MLWDREGKWNTAGTIDAALAAGRELGLKHLVVASNSGETVEGLLQRDLDGLSVVCVTHQVGFKTPGVDEMGEEMRTRLTEAGVRLLTTTHLFGGVDRALRLRFNGYYPPEIIADSLRMFGHGVKVCVEVAVMALDAGLIPHGVNVVCVGGRARGADTACVIRPAHSLAFFDTRVVELICRPRPKVG
jgi:uncharacterized protein